MKRFPGRFLSEIESQMDWFRFLRAVEAEHIERIEERRELQVSGELKSKDLEQDEWKQILSHDKILREYG